MAFALRQTYIEPGCEVLTTQGRPPSATEFSSRKTWRGTEWFLSIVLRIGEVQNNVTFFFHPCELHPTYKQYRSVFWRYHVSKNNNTAKW